VQNFVLGQNLSASNKHYTHTERHCTQFCSTFEHSLWVLCYPRRWI